jgi:hypothetical protein
MISNQDVLKLIFGFKIKHLRLQQQKSYQELAEKTGLSTSYLHDIEKGKKYPKPDKIQALAESLGVGYDDLISTRTDKKLRPVVELLNSDFFKFFPLDEFGISVDKLVDVFTSAPDRINAFISTILKMVRSYQIEKEHFYRIALRSYQDIHDNYFPEIEHAASQFRDEHHLPTILDTKTLEQILKSKYDISVDREKLPRHAELKGFRSYFDPEKHTLFLNEGLMPAQEAFIMGKELGFQFLGLQDRPRETQLNQHVSFEKLLSNFKASYFSAALKMDEKEMVADIEDLSRQSQWSAEAIRKLLSKYQVTPENLLQRWTNILPHHFGLDDIFFFRLKSDQSLVNYQITKELHLSQLHNPYRNETQEHLCQRWISIRAIKMLHNTRADPLIEAQVSAYWNTPNAYFCITMAQSSGYQSAQPYSVTIGLLMTEKLRATFNFLKDPELAHKVVNNTCERCGIADCDNRGAAPHVVIAQEKEKKLEEVLRNL